MQECKLAVNGFQEMFVNIPMLCWTMAGCSLKEKHIIMCTDTPRLQDSLSFIIMVTFSMKNIAFYHVKIYGCVNIVYV